jgi:hypothetical protein
LGNIVKQLPSYFCTRLLKVLLQNVGVALPASGFRKKGRIDNLYGASIKVGATL